METDKETDARYTLLLVSCRDAMLAPLQDLKNTYGDAEDVEELEAAIASFFAERLFVDPTQAKDLCVEAETAFHKETGKWLQGTMAPDGLSIELRSLNIPQYNKAVGVHAVKFTTELGPVWVFHELPPKKKNGDFLQYQESKHAVSGAKPRSAEGSKFKVGDKVRRVQHGTAVVPYWSVWTVGKSTYTGVSLQEIPEHGLFEPEYFDLVEEPIESARQPACPSCDRPLISPRS